MRNLTKEHVWLARVYANTNMALCEFGLLKNPLRYLSPLALNIYSILGLLAGQKLCLVFSVKCFEDLKLYVILEESHTYFHFSRVV